MLSWVLLVRGLVCEPSLWVSLTRLRIERGKIISGRGPEASRQSVYCAPHNKSFQRTGKSAEFNRSAPTSTQ